MTSRLRRMLSRLAGRRLRAGIRTFIKASSFYDMPCVVGQPGNSKIVVLAPHMDDEVLGCGGTIARHIAAGAKVQIVFLTDGRRGGVVFSDHGSQSTPDELVAFRKEEAHRAATILGIQSLTFLDGEDSRLHSNTAATGRLRNILERERPEIVYLPFMLEGHPDHRAASDMLMAATIGSSLRLECRAYEVWTPLFPNYLVNIDETVHLKKMALACYQSQLAVMDYLHSGIGLNAYRAMGLGNNSGRYAEAFYVSTLAEYRRLYATIRHVT
jgi:LmbE family N-acetylglucosaminyl deacetylase